MFRIIEARWILARLAVAGMTLYWLTLNLVVIAEDERAAVTHWGRFEEVLEPGLHWRWPPPMERVVREKVGLIRVVQIGFRSEKPAVQQPARPQRPIEWTSRHAETEYQPEPEESFVLTGNEVPVELTAEVHYKIADLRQYAFEAARPEETIRAAAENAIREVAAGASLDGLLTDRRADIENACLESVRQRIASYGLGVEIVDVALLDVHPPRAVVPAYRDVADAMEEREQRINEAQAYYAQKVLAAAGERAIELLNSAAAPQPEESGDAPRVERAGSVVDWHLDDALWAKLTDDRPDHPMIVSGEAGATLLSAHVDKTRKIQNATGAASRFQSLLDAYTGDPALTELQLYWETIEQSLSTRPLTIIDPAAAGRQHLLLVDPEQFGGAAAIQQLAPQDAGRGEADNLVPIQPANPPAAPPSDTPFSEEDM